MRPLPMISCSCGECHECCVAFALIPEPPWWDEYKPVGAFLPLFVRRRLRHPRLATAGNMHSVSLFLS